MVLSNTSSEGTETKPSLLIETLLCFSVRRHYRSITKMDAFDDRYKFLYGLRFLSFLWILYAYTYIYQHILSVGNTIKLRHLPQQFAFQIFMNGTLAAETFFFMSGFTVSLFTFKLLSENERKRLNLVTFYFSRIWRQVPVISFAIVILIIWPLVGSGPIWTETIGYFADQCRGNWIPTTLFFSNFEKIQDMVIQHLIAFLLIFLFLLIITQM